MNALAIRGWTWAIFSLFSWHLSCLDKNMKFANDFSLAFLFACRYDQHKGNNASWSLNLFPPNLRGVA